MKAIQLSQTACLAAALAASLTFSACSTAPGTAEGKTELRHTSEYALSEAQKNDDTLADFIRHSAGYAVFPEVGKGAIGVGGAYGKGDVYQAGAVIGYCDMTQASIGFQLGGQAYSEILVFEDAAALERFKNGNVRFDAQATAVALKSGAGANAKFANGVAVFTMDEAGLMYEASVGGQKFSYQER
jgi:lipid-binding SYLF domain-containing protein